ncbi:MAG: c-type cytochrome [Planctomycetes bacterium]|nr:c-type cytochrome [Planctomycetota bacterium]
MIASALHHRLAVIGCGALLGLVALAACSGSDAPAPKSGGSKSAGKSAQISPEEAVKRARNQYDTVCLTCHGAGGKGDGPGAAALDPKPRTFTDSAWQKSVTDEAIIKAIVYGGAAVGKSVNMPSHPLLKDQTQMLAELVKIIRAFDGKG